MVGEIPNAQARFAELTPVPDEVYQFLNYYWSNDLGAHCAIKPSRHDGVYNSILPIRGLTQDIEYNPNDEGFEEDLEKINLQREFFLNKLFSFVLTIHRGDAIIYRIAGWDVPIEDREAYHIDETLYGYYDTAPESYLHNGVNCTDPLLYSKLWPEGVDASIPGTVTYFIKVTAKGAFLREFYPYFTDVDEDYYWKNN